MNSKKKEAYELYQILKQTEDFDKDKLLIGLENFKKYLALLSSQIFKKSPKIGFIYLWLFNNEYDSKDAEKPLKANIYAASKSLDRVAKFVSQNKFDNYLRRLLTDFVCDLKPFIVHFDKNQDYNWLHSNTKSHISNFYHDLSRSVFFTGMPGSHEEEKLSLASSTPFIIRQSIEYKIKRILGINYIEKNGKLDKTEAKLYFKALRNNKEFYTTRKFDFETVEKIYSWTHLYIHGGVRPLPWITETALSYLKEFFYSGETTQPNSWSMYAGIEISKSNEELLFQRTEETIKSEIGDSVEINWSRPEVAFIN